MCLGATLLGKKLLFVIQLCGFALLLRLVVESWTVENMSIDKQRSKGMVGIKRILNGL